MPDHLGPLILAAILAHAAWSSMGRHRIRKDIRTMSQATDDLAASVGDLATAVASENAEIDTLTEKLATLTPGQDDDAIEATVGQIKGLTAGINAKLASLNPTPAPAPDAPADTTTAGQAS